MIRTEHESGIFSVMLDRPDKRNAMTPAMLESLGEAIGRATTEDARALVLGGEGAVFCGGFDLLMCLEKPGTLAELLTGLSRTITTLRHLPIPVVIAAHGAAIAGACALLGGGDVVVTNRSAKLGYPVLPLGISPAVSAPSLGLQVGTGPARTRLLNPALIDGTEALRIGLAHELVEMPNEVRARALSIAKDLSEKPRGAIAATRAWLAEVDLALSGDDPERGLQASLALADNGEMRERLSSLFS
jgi:methylglutaconyl-CoA hydratase